MLFFFANDCAQVLPIHPRSDCRLVVVTRRLMPVDSDVTNPNKHQPRDEVYDWFRCSGEVTATCRMELDCQHLLFTVTPKNEGRFSGGDRLSTCSSCCPDAMMGKNRTGVGGFWKCFSLFSSCCLSRCWRVCNISSAVDML